MITEILIGAAISGLIATDKAEKIKKLSDEEYGRAITRRAKADAAFIKAEKDLNIALARMINKKHSVLNGTFKRFIEVAQQIKSIEFYDNELAERMSEQVKNIKSIQSADVSLHNIIDPLSDKQLATRFLIGIGTGLVLTSVSPGVALYSAIVKDAKIERENTKLMVKESRVYTKYANINAEAYNLLNEHLTLLSDTIQGLNILFVKSINYCDSIFKNKGTDFNNFCKDEKESIVIMFDIAEALNILVCTPIIEENNKITSEIIKLLEVSDQVYDNFYTQMNEICK